MAYAKNEWKARQGTGKNRYRKSRETEEYVCLDNEPESITEPGTPFDVAKMNRIEQGIGDAHEAVAAEAREREAAGTRLEALVEEEARGRAAADRYLQEQINVLSPEGQNEHAVSPVLDHPDGSVTTAKLADSAVETGKIKDGAVTSAKLAASPAFTGEPKKSYNNVSHPLAVVPNISSASATDYPVGTYILAGGSSADTLDRNASVTVALYNGMYHGMAMNSFMIEPNEVPYTIHLSGTWRVSGATSIVTYYTSGPTTATMNQRLVLLRRVA